MNREPDVAEIMKSPKTIFTDEEGNVFFGWQFFRDGKRQFIIDYDGTKAIRARAA